MRSHWKYQTGTRWQLALTTDWKTSISTIFRRYSESLPKLNQIFSFLIHSHAIPKFHESRPIAHHCILLPNRQMRAAKWECATWLIKKARPNYSYCAMSSLSVVLSPPERQRPWQRKRSVAIDFISRHLLPSTLPPGHLPRKSSSQHLPSLDRVMVYSYRVGVYGYSWS